MWEASPAFILLRDAAKSGRRTCRTMRAIRAPRSQPAETGDHDCREAQGVGRAHAGGLRELAGGLLASPGFGAQAAAPRARPRSASPSVGELIGGLGQAALELAAP